MEGVLALFQAFEQKEYERVFQLASAQPHILLSYNEHGVSAIMLAAYHQQSDLCLNLARLKENLDLNEAIVSGDIDRCKLLLTETPTLLKEFAPDGFSYAGLAAYFGQLEVLQFLVEKGADLNIQSTNISKVAPIHAAVAIGRIDILTYLLDNNCKVNPRQADGITPLHSAAYRGNLEMVKLLLLHGADPTILSDRRESAIDFAKKHDNQHVVDLLQSAKKI